MATGRIGTTPVLQVRWSKAPSAGTTSLSGLDDNSVSLVYSVGYEAVYRNGVLLSRGNDYTATNGTTITLIDATFAGDIIEVFANQTIPLSDTYSQTVSDGRFIKNTLTTTTGDIIYASAANTPARLGIGSTGNVLTVSGGVPAWAAPASGAYTSLATGTLSSSQVDITSISGSYRDLVLIIRNYKPANDNSSIYWAFNNDRNNRYDYNSSLFTDTAKSFGNNYMVGGRGNDNSVASGLCILTIPDYANTTTWKIAFTKSIEVNATTTTQYNFYQNMMFYNQTAAISQINILDSGGSFTSGDYVLYGVK